MEARGCLQNSTGHSGASQALWRWQGADGGGDSMGKKGGTLVLRFFPAMQEVPSGAQQHYGLLSPSPVSCPVLPTCSCWEHSGVCSLISKRGEVRGVRKVPAPAGTMLWGAGNTGALCQGAGDHRVSPSSPQGSVDPPGAVWWMQTLP